MIQNKNINAMNMAERYFIDEYDFVDLHILKEDPTFEFPDELKREKIQTTNYDLETNLAIIQDGLQDFLQNRYRRHLRINEFYGSNLSQETANICQLKSRMETDVDKENIENKRKSFWQKLKSIFCKKEKQKQKQIKAKRSHKHKRHKSIHINDGGQTLEVKQFLDYMAQNIETPSPKTVSSFDFDDSKSQSAYDTQSLHSYKSMRESYILV